MQGKQSFHPGHQPSIVFSASLWSNENTALLLKQIGFYHGSHGVAAANLVTKFLVRILWPENKIY